VSQECVAVSWEHLFSCTTKKLQIPIRLRSGQALHSPSTRFTRSGSGPDDAVWANYRLRTLDFLDVLRLQANADEASGEIRKTRNAGEQTEQERRAEGAGIAKDVG
jgi:hypothetical protein